MVAHSTDLRACFASGTVKKRIRMCGRPAVPNISAMPNEIAEIGSFTKPPGPIIDRPVNAASSGALPLLAAIWVLTRTASLNSASKLKLKCHITITAMKVTPDSNRQALMICTQVVAVMPPNST
ncbi:hypothetical protein D3C81_1752400 [compost metagenome]